jgi:hypothetical protein
VCAGQRRALDPSNQVLPLEFGGPVVNLLLYIPIPKGFFFTLRGGRYACRYRTQRVGPGGQAEPVTPVRG